MGRSGNERRIKGAEQQVNSYIVLYKMAITIIVLVTTR
jgi:hypothetical protein